jgi:hypothetical protein
MTQKVMLPSGDLYHPQEYDNDGKLIDRSTSTPVETTATALSNGIPKGPDVSAIIMAELQEARTQLEARK